MTAPIPDQPSAQQVATFDAVPNNNFGLERDRLLLEAGWLGRVFGIGAAAPISIAGFTVAALLLLGSLTLFFDTKIPAPEFWKLTTPVLTLVLGYVFGRKS